MPFLDRPGIPPVDKPAALRWFFYALIGFLVGQVLGGVFGAAAGDWPARRRRWLRSAQPACRRMVRRLDPDRSVDRLLRGALAGQLTRGTRHLWADLGRAVPMDRPVGIAIGIGGQIVIALLYAPFRHDIRNFDGPSQKLTGGAHGGGFLLVALATVLLAPFMEELFFRGLLFKALARLFTPQGRAGPPGPGCGHRPGRRRRRAAVRPGPRRMGAAGRPGALRDGPRRHLLPDGATGMNMVAHASFNLVAILAILGQRGGVH